MKYKKIFQFIDQKNAAHNIYEFLLSNLMKELIPMKDKKELYMLLIFYKKIKLYLPKISQKMIIHYLDIFINFLETQTHFRD